MAKLVKFKTEPHKFFAARHQQFWPPNQIISREIFEHKKNSYNNNNKYHENICELIKNYINKISIEKSQAHTRGFVFRRQRTIAEIITLVALWQNNISRESQAIIELSKTIAELIINTNTDQDLINNLKNSISQKLNKFFYINIYAQDHIYNNLPKINNINYLNPINKQEIIIFANNKELVISLESLDVRKIIMRAVKNIAAGPFLNSNIHDRRLSSYFN